jgi:hypothetical protein
VIEGRLQDATAFAGLTADYEDHATVLTGLVRDGEHLMSLLNRILELDVTLVSLQAMD